MEVQYHIVRTPARGAVSITQVRLRKLDLEVMNKVLNQPPNTKVSTLLSLSQRLEETQVEKTNRISKLSTKLCGIGKPRETI